MPNLSQDFKARIEANGLWAAMRWLNAKGPYRYSAIFAFEGPMLRNICLVDKHDPDITGCADQPVTESYCIYIYRSGDTFAVEKASHDPRVEGHPKQRAFQCYYGVPLYDAHGKMLGTVCHFDVDSKPLQTDSGAVLHELAPLIARAAFGE